MHSFKEYFFEKNKRYFNILTEDPDTINTNLNGKRIILRWDSILAKPFGFINPNASFDLKGTEQKFFIDSNVQNDLLIGEKQTAHGMILKQLIKSLTNGYIVVHDVDSDKYLKIDLSNPNLKNKILTDYKYRFPLNSHKVLDPCGRVWINAKINNKEYSIISFWENNVPITKNQIEELINKLNLSEESILIENPLDNKMLLTKNQFINILDNINNGIKQSTPNYKELAHLAAGFGGAFKHKKGFGSHAEAEKAKKAGFNNVSKYKNVRFPHKESFVPL